jgi:tetratricopeptide (TPR) repeat protein
MKKYKRFIIIVFCLFAASNSLAQLTAIKDMDGDTSFIIVQDVTQKPMYKNQQCNCKGCNETNACLNIITDKRLALDLVSYSDKNEDKGSEWGIVKVDTLGNEIYYSIKFPTGYEYRNRLITLTVSLTIVNTKILGASYDIALNLLPGQSIYYNILLCECAAPLIASGKTNFLAGNYQKAKTDYTASQNCYDKPTDESVEKTLLNIDTIISYLNAADINFELLNFKDAKKYYDSVVLKNPNDHITNRKRKETNNKLEEWLYRYTNRANLYFVNHEYEKAQLLYQIVAKESYDNQILHNNTIDRLDLIKQKLEDIKFKSTVFNYEFGFNKISHTDIVLPIGFSWGGYRDKRGGFYFSLRTNTDLFEAIRQNYEKAARPDISITMGGSVRPVKNKYVPVWLFFGTGGIMVATCADKFDPYFAMPFETGILIKYKRLAVRYTFQYRYAFQSEHIDYIGKMIHFVGIGIAY